MGTKTLVRLLVALAVIGAIAAIIHFTGGGSVSTVTSTTQKKKVYPDFPLNEVATIQIKEKEGSITLSKGENTWEVSEREGYPANAEPIIHLLRKVWDVTIVQPITIGRSQYGRLGLLAPEEAPTPEEAATVITFQDKEGKEMSSLWLGKVYERSEGRPDPFSGGMATSEAGRYLKRGDSNAVYLVSETFAEVKIDPTDWIDKTFFKVENIKSIEIVSKDKGEDWKLDRSSADEEFKLAGAAAGENLDPGKVSAMKSAFSNAQLEDILVGEDKKSNPVDSTTFKIVTFEDFTYEISVGEKNDLNELPMTLKVSGKLPEKRVAGEEESADEKAKLDKDFTDRVASLSKKLEQEKKLEGHVFKIRSFMVDSILKKRSELMAEKEAADGTEEAEVAPGISLPGMSLPGIPPQAVPAPQAKPAVPAPAPAPEAKPATPAPAAKPASPAPAPEAKPASPAPAPEAKPAAPAPAPAAKPATPAPAPEAKPPAPVPVEAAPEAKEIPDAPAPAPAN